MPAVTVILTSYNHSKFLRESIESVLNQTFSDFELVIIDDCSSDNSWEIIESYQDPRIIAIRNDRTRRGIYGINKAITEIAKGHYIAIHHSDDLWEPDKLEKQVAFLDEHLEYGAVFSWVKMIDEEGNEISQGSNGFFEPDHFNRPNRSRYEWLNHFFYYGNVLCHPTVLIRTECFEKIGLYRYGYAQTGDYLMWINLCLNYEIHILEECLIRYRVLKNELNASANRPEVHIRARNEIFAFLELYLQIKSAADFSAIFPEHRELITPDGFVPEFAIAMVSLDKTNSKMHHLFGLKTLYEIFQSVEMRQKIEKLYHFTYMDLITLSGKYDLFNYKAEEFLGGITRSICREWHINLSDEKIKNPSLNRIKWHPDIDYYCKIRITEISSDGDVVKIQPFNHTDTINGQDIFLNSYPEYLLTGDFSNSTFIFVKGVVENINLSQILKTTRDIYRTGVHNLLSLYKSAQDKNIIIFGAGSAGKQFLEYFPVEPVYFIDNDQNKWGEKFSGIPIKAPHQILSENIDSILILICSMYGKEISKQLEAFGLKENIHFLDVYSMYEWIFSS